MGFRACILLLLMGSATLPVALSASGSIDLYLQNSSLVTNQNTNLNNIVVSEPPHCERCRASCSMSLR